MYINSKSLPYGIAVIVVGLLIYTIEFGVLNVLEPISQGLDAREFQASFSFYEIEKQREEIKVLKAKLEKANQQLLECRGSNRSSKLGNDESSALTNLEQDMAPTVKQDTNFQSPDRSKEAYNTLLQKYSKLQTKLVQTTNKLENVTTLLHQAQHNSTGSQTQRNRHSNTFNHSFLQTTLVGSSTVLSDEFNRFMTIIRTSKVLSEARNQVLQHSETLVRRSRPIIGNTERLRVFVRKLLDRQCTTVMFVGGSVTRAARDSRGNYKSAYHAEFVKYLNEMYPCATGEHVLVVHGPGGTDSAYAISNFAQLFRETNGHMDLVFFEYAINDASAVPVPGHDKAETVQINTEILIRKILLYRNNNGSAPAIVWLETSFFLRNLMKHDMKTDKTATHAFAAGVHFPILSYYDIPTVSAAQVWFPIAAKDLRQVSIVSSPIRKYFRDICHPSYVGHVYIAQVIALAIETEKAWLLQGSQLSELERDLSLLKHPMLPEPWWLSPKEMNLQVSAQRSEFNFQTEVPQNKSLIYNTGWEVFADSKGKFGLISTQSGSHVSFGVKLLNFDPSSSLTQHIGGEAESYKRHKDELVQSSFSTVVNKVTIGFLKTYKHISDLYVWTDGEPDGRQLCTKLVSNTAGFCHKFNCDCETFNKMGPPSWGGKPLFWKWTQGRSAKCVRSFVASNATISSSTFAENSTQTSSYSFPNSVMPPGIELQRIDPVNEVKTSVYSHFDVRLSQAALQAASNDERIYVHVCSTRFGELTAPRVANAKEKPPSEPGDGKFKILLVGAINGLVQIEKVADRAVLVIAL